jgi:prenylated cyclic peptide (anacyclamide/piricyclamide family)
MKKNLKNQMPQTVAPVQRETSATVSRDGTAIAPAYATRWSSESPFAGDDAE